MKTLKPLNPAMCTFLSMVLSPESVRNVPTSRRIRALLNEMPVIPIESEEFPYDYDDCIADIIGALSLGYIWPEVSDALLAFAESDSTNQRQVVLLRELLVSIPGFYVTIFPEEAYTSSDAEAFEIARMQYFPSTDVII